MSDVYDNPSPLKNMMSQYNHDLKREKASDDEKPLIYNEQITVTETSWKAKNIPRDEWCLDFSKCPPAFKIENYSS